MYIPNHRLLIKNSIRKDYFCMNNSVYQGKNNNFITDINFQVELTFIYEELFDRDTEKFEELMNQFQLCLKYLDQDWKTNSKKLVKPKLSTYNYRKIKFFSSRQLQRTLNSTPDFRVIFKYLEEENTLYLLTIGIRVDKYNNTYLPKPYDLYLRSQQKTLPEEE